MTREEQIHILEDYANDLSLPNWKWKQSKFYYRSISRWAAQEVLKYVYEQTDISVESAIEQFIAKADTYSCFYSAGNYVFSVAKDLAEDMLYQIT